MTPIPIMLAVEDRLSEVVARKILQETRKNYTVDTCLIGGGFGYLKSRINSFNKVAQRIPFFVLTDQDSGCPPGKIASWMPQRCHPNMIFRIAVMEVESWVMAHRNAFANFLSIPLSIIPPNTDSVDDPKRLLISLAKRSRLRRLKADLVPPSGATSKQGPNYNDCLAQFIWDNWDVHIARSCSESLDRAFARLQRFEPIYSKKQRWAE